MPPNRLKNNKTIICRNRISVTRDVYRVAGYSPQRAFDHVGGIEFGQKVYETTFKKGTVLEQWLKLDENGNPVPGDYYTLPGADPTKLGINLEGRKKYNVTLQEDTKFLKSTTADINDTWSQPGKSIDVKGGEIQLFQVNVKKDVKPAQ